MFLRVIPHDGQYSLFFSHSGALTSILYHNFDGWFFMHILLIAVIKKDDIFEYHCKNNQGRRNGVGLGGPGPPCLFLWVGPGWAEKKRAPKKTEKLPFCCFESALFKLGPPSPFSVPASLRTMK